MGLIHEIDYGTKKLDSNVLVTVTIDGHRPTISTLFWTSIPFA